MTECPTEQPDAELAKRLTYAACAAWACSLALPGFLVEAGEQVWFGVVVLQFGLLLGWAVGGWAVYANLFFVKAAYGLLFDRRPGLSVLAMLALAATLPLFQGVIHSRATMQVLPVLSWGWGAIAWMFSLLLLATAAAIRARLLAPRGARRVLSGLLAGLLLVGGLHLHHLHAASDLERDSYLPPGMAFTLEPLCGVALTQVGAPYLAPGTIVALDIDPDLRAVAGASGLALPKLANYQQDGFAWVTHRDPATLGEQVRIRMPARADYPVLEVRKSEQGAVIRLREHPAGRHLYEQRLKAMSGVHGGARYCPVPAAASLAGPHGGYHTQLMRALGQEPAPGQQGAMPLAREAARIPCSLGSTDTDGVKGLRNWDGRQVILHPASRRSRPGFCSDSYIALVDVDQRPAAHFGYMSASVQLFDRKTLRPLGSFSNGRRCPQGECRDAPPGHVTGVRIADDRITVETGAGELIAHRVDGGRKGAPAG